MASHGIRPLECIVRVYICILYENRFGIIVFIAFCKLEI
jgi:hypothetical protein